MINRSAHSAGPTPKACGLVIWFFGDLVVVVCSAIQVLADSLQKTCKVAIWRSSCGLEGLKTATWMPCWLQDGLERAKLSPS